MDAILTNISLVVVAVILIILIVALFAKKSFIVQREITICSSINNVFDYIKFLENHHSFSKWATKDVSKKTERRGVDGTPGFIQTWNNFKEKAGTGELEIKQIVDCSHLLLEHRYFKPVPGIGNSLITTRATSYKETNVKWQYNGFSRYPINFFTAVMNIDKIIGGDLENCLKKLKCQLEVAQGQEKTNDRS